MKEHLLRFTYGVPEGYLCQFGEEEDKKKFQGLRQDVNEFCPLEELLADGVRKRAIKHGVAGLTTVSRYDIAKEIEND
jgi:hypothetical protein